MNSQKSFSQKLTEELFQMAVDNPKYDRVTIQIIDGEAKFVGHENIPCEADFEEIIGSVGFLCDEVEENEQATAEENVEKFDCEYFFSLYTENDNLAEADVFHLYDTGKECMKDYSGYVDSRHFELVAFNSQTMQKCHMGRHDGIQAIKDNVPVKNLQVFADGSFFIRLHRLVKMANFQCIDIY